MNKCQILQLIISLLFGLLYGKWSYDIDFLMEPLNCIFGILLLCLYFFKFEKQYDKFYKIALGGFILFSIFLLANIIYPFYALILYFMRFRVNYRKISIFLLLITYISGIFISAPQFDFDLYKLINVPVTDLNNHTFIFDTVFSFLNENCISIVMALFVSELLYFDIFKNPVPEKLGKLLDNNSLRGIAYFTVLYYILWQSISLEYLNYIPGPFWEFD